MERTLKPARDSQTIFISPAAKGWRCDSALSGKRTAATLAEAIAPLPSNTRIHLALPSSAVLFERMRLPATDAVELEGMVRLQLEKTVPFSIEDVTSSFEIVGQLEKNSVVLAAVVPNSQLAAICQPLRERGQLPAKITVFALHVVARCPKHPLVFLIYREQEKYVVAISENGKLSFAHTIAAADAETFLAELPQLLLGVEMDEIPTTFTRVQLDKECSEMQPALAQLFGVPVDLISLDTALPEAGANLVPSAWQQARKRTEKTAQIKTRIIAAVALYLAVLLGAFGYLFWLQRKVANLDKQIHAAQPQLDFIRTRKAHWIALSPAIDPTRYTVELLLQIQKSLPSDAIHITAFEQTVDGFSVEGEAPTANLAIEFGEQLKKNPDLKDFKFTIGPPAILPNDHAQFRIFAKS